MGQAVHPAAQDPGGPRRQPAMARGRVQRPVDRGLSRRDGPGAMTAPRSGAALPSPDLPLLAALHVVEASVWLAIVASYKAGGAALPALPGGVSGLVFLFACVVGLLAAVVIVRRHRRTRHEPRRFAFTVALNVAPVILLLAAGEVAVRLV